MSGARTLDEVIRWGSNELFAHYPDAPGGQQQEPQPAGATGPAAGEAPATEAAAASGQPAAQQPEAAGKDGSPGDVEMQDASAAGAGAGGTEGPGTEAEPNLPPAAVAAGTSGALVAKLAVQPLSYSSGQVEQVLQKGAAACAAAAAAAAAGSSDAAAAGGGDASVPSDLGLGLESVVVRLWPAVDKGVDHDCGELLLL